MRPGAPRHEQRSPGIGVERPCRTEDLGASLIGERIVHQDNCYPLQPSLRTLECFDGVLGKKFTADPEISAERALQLTLDAP